MVRDLSIKFETLKVEHIGREENKHANALANLGSSVDIKSARMIPLTYV